MSRGGSAGRTWVTRKGRCEVRFLKNGYAPTVHMGIVMDDRYYRTLAAAARVGTGYSLTRESLPVFGAGRKSGRKAVLAPEDGAWYNSICLKDFGFFKPFDGIFSRGDAVC